MKADIKHAFQQAIQTAKQAENKGQFNTAFSALEHAHILGQRYLLPHIYTHFLMLRVGYKRRDQREITGQLLRIIASVPGYLFGWVPKGNTGGANVSPLKPMPLPEELAPLLDDYNVWRDVAVRILLYSFVALILIYS